MELSALNYLIKDGAEHTGALLGKFLERSIKNTSKMKRILFIVTILFCLLANISAQTVTKNSMPKNLTGVRMNLRMDFSNAVIFGMSEKEFAEYEKDWYDDKPTVIRNFKVGANLTLGKAYGIGDYKDAPYIVKVVVNTITEEGFIICDVDIEDEKGEVLFHIDHLTGGKEPSLSIGTKMARIKVWASLTGKKLGSILKSELTNN